MATEIKRREMILKGNLLKTILAICMPLALYQFFNSAYTLVDQIICANISTTAQNAVSSISQIKSAISAFGGGLAAGGCVLVARYYGAGDVKASREASSNLYTLAIIMSAILLLVLVPFAKIILEICQIAEQSIKIGVPYFQFQMVELIFVTLNSVFIGIEKAKGNSRRILVLNIFVLIVKLALTCIFIYGFKLNDIVYVELATIIAQATLTVIGWFILFNKKNIIHLEFKMLLLKWKYVSIILKLSLPIFLGKFVMSMGKVVVNAMCGAYWNTATDGLIVGTLGVSNNISGLITSPTNSFEEGESSIVSQNLGNKNMKRALKTFYWTLGVVTVVSLAGWVLLRFVLCDNIVELFTLAKRNKAVSAEEMQELETYKQMIKDIFVYDSLSIPSLGIAAAVLGLLYGYGQTGLSTIFNLSRIGSRIVILLLFHTLAPDMSATLCAGLSMGISNIFILIVAIVFLLIFLIRVRKKGYKGMYFTDPEPQMAELFFGDEEKNTNDQNDPKPEGA